MRRISVCLWFNNQAEAAAEFYTSTFDRSKITGTVPYGEAGTEIHGGEPGSVMTVDFELDGFSFTALNGGPQFRPNPSISFFANCTSADEVDALWARLSENGSVLMPLDEYPFSRRYGWVEDRFGVSWQVILSETEPRQRFIPSLLFVGDRCGKAEEAIGFYTSVFRNAKRGSLFPYGADQPPNRKGTLMYADFELEGQLFSAMDSALEHRFDFTEGFRSSSIAATRRRSTTTGAGSPRFPRPRHAAG